MKAFRHFWILGWIGTGCVFVWMGHHRPEPEPTYSTVPPHHKIVDTPEEVVTFHFRFLQEHPPEVTDIVSNGWHVVSGLPELDNYEAVSNYWRGQGIESTYVGNVIYFRHR